jgi:hypothetical protein
MVRDAVERWLGISGEERIWAAVLELALINLIPELRQLVGRCSLLA